MGSEMCIRDRTGSARAGVGSITPQPRRGIVLDRSSRSPRSVASSDGPPTAGRQTNGNRARTNLNAVLSTASATPQTVPATMPTLADVVRGHPPPNMTSPPSATPTPQEPNLTQPTQVQAPCSCKMAYLQNSAQTKALSDEWALTPEEEKCIGRTIRTMSPTARRETIGRTIGIAIWRHQWLRACLVMVAVIEGTLLREGHRYPHLPETNILKTLTHDRMDAGHHRRGQRDGLLDDVPRASTPRTLPTCYTCLCSDVLFLILQNYKPLHATPPPPAVPPLTALCATSVWQSALCPTSLPSAPPRPALCACLLYTSPSPRDS